MSSSAASQPYYCARGMRTIPTLTLTGLRIFEALLQGGCGVCSSPKSLERYINVRGRRQSVLQKAAAVFRRPLIAFYLPDVPRRGERGEDFRASASAGGS